MKRYNSKESKEDGTSHEFVIQFESKEESSCKDRNEVGKQLPVLDGVLAVAIEGKCLEDF